MKYLVILIFSLFTSFLLSAQADCEPYLPGGKGTTWEVTNYNDKGKETGRIVNELVDVVKTPNGATYTVKAVYYDKKGKEGYSSTYEARCEDGIFKLDMGFMVNGEAMQAYQNMEAEVDATEFELPGMNTPAGTALPDASMTMRMGSGGISVLTMTMNVTNRKVEGKETLTTPAGTFDCVKMSQTVHTKSIIGVEASSVDWYAEGVGMVRSESYNKNGKLMGYSELTKLEKM